MKKVTFLLTIVAIVIATCVVRGNPPNPAQKTYTELIQQGFNSGVVTYQFSALPLQGEIFKGDGSSITTNRQEIFCSNAPMYNSRFKPENGKEPVDYGISVIDTNYTTYLKYYFICIPH